MTEDIQEVKIQKRKVKIKRPYQRREVTYQLAKLKMI